MTALTSIRTSRVIWGLDSLASAVQGGWMGNPGNYTATNGLACGGTFPGRMFAVPWQHNPPDIADEHIYPCIRDPSTSSKDCYNTDGPAGVQSEAATFFGHIPHFLAAANQKSSVVMLGETITNSNDGNNENCEIDAPLDAPALIVAGYNSPNVYDGDTPLPGNNTVVIRPFINLEYSCFTPVNQQLNVNNSGPYTPSLH